mmetsp:Transcript_27021/g.42405  ORF Transcript_27021/g.42405 Transcript_27021/m.42405 type:complete len:271 (-) Transcript_27021:1218-2030(-)
MEGSQLALPLLSDVDRDEEIISQLLNTNDSDERRQSSRCCSHFKVSRKHCVAISFALLLLFGLMSSILSAASCNLIGIDYNKGGVELTIQALGFWRYEQKVTNGTHVANYCVPYGQKVHKEINLDGFFPEDKTLQAYSIVSPSAVFMSILALMICIVEVRLQPEIMFGRLIPEYVDPLTTIRSSALAGVLLVIGGIMQMVATFSLLYYHPKSTASGYESPLCNPAYSHCKLGSIGIWSVCGSLSLFVAGVISCYSSRRIARRHGKGKMLC